MWFSPTIASQVLCDGRNIRLRCWLVYFRHTWTWTGIDARPCVKLTSSTLPLKEQGTPVKTIAIHVQGKIVMTLLCILVGAGLFYSPAGQTDTQLIRTEMVRLRATTDKAYQDVVDELDFAITERNFRLTGRNVVGSAIRKRGHPEFPDVEVIHFCNLENAREVLEIDPEFVAQMPCRVMVNTSGDQTVINMILLPENNGDERIDRFARRLNQDLRAIVDFVLEEDAK